MSRLGQTLLGALVNVWPDPTRARTEKYGARPATDEYDRKYAEEQFLKGVWHGSPLGDAMPPVWGKRVLEIGCGHGGISCYFASLGAKSVLGIDLGAEHIRFGRELQRRLETDRGGALPVTFALMDAHRLALPQGCVDFVLADNVFEHFTDPGAAMREVFRVLSPGGVLVVPLFSSIRSKWGLHLKHGLKLPWANLAFSEDTIVETLLAQSRSRPELLEYYPGLKGSPRSVREVRRFKDLNAITHEAFRALATEAGFELRAFRVHATKVGQVLRKLAPSLEQRTPLEVLSTGAGAVLMKPM